MAINYSRMIETCCFCKKTPPPLGSTFHQAFSWVPNLRLPYIGHHQPSLTIIHHHSPPFTIINHVSRGNGRTLCVATTRRRRSHGLRRSGAFERATVRCRRWMSRGCPMRSDLPWVKQWNHPWLEMVFRTHDFWWWLVMIFGGYWQKNWPHQLVFWEFWKKKHRTETEAILYDVTISQRGCGALRSIAMV